MLHADAVAEKVIQPGHAHLLRVFLQAGLALARRLLGDPGAAPAVDESGGDLVIDGNSRLRRFACGTFLGLSVKTVLHPLHLTLCGFPGVGVGAGARMPLAVIAACVILWAGTMFIRAQLGGGDGLALDRLGQEAGVLGGTVALEAALRVAHENGKHVEQSSTRTGTASVQSTASRLF